MVLQCAWCRAGGGSLDYFGRDVARLWDRDGLEVAFDGRWLRGFATDVSIEWQDASREVRQRLSDAAGCWLLPHQHFGRFVRSMRRARVALVVHDTIRFRDIACRSSVAGRMTQAGVYLACADLEGVRRADVIVVPSASVGHELVAWHGVARSRILVMPLAPGDEFQAAEVMGARQPRLLCVGSDQPRKRTVSLVRGFLQYCRVSGDTDATLTVIGALGARHAESRKILAGLLAEDETRRRVQLLDPRAREQMWELYDACDVVIAPSGSEGYGLPIVEAMACGRRLLIAPVPAMLETAAGQATIENPSGRWREFVGRGADLGRTPCARARSSGLRLVCERRTAWRGEFFRTLRSALLSVQ